MIKLNYTLAPAPGRAGRGRARRARPGARSRRPVLVISLHGHLAPVAWARGRGAPGAAARLRPGRRARRCPGSLSRDVASCASAGCSAATSPPAPAYGGEHEAISLRRRRSTPPRGDSAGTRSSSGPGPGSSARRPGSATAGWRRSTPRTRRSRSGCRRCSARGCRARDERDAPPRAQPSHGRRCSSCCWRRCGCRCPRPSSRAGRCSATEGAPEGGSAQAALDDLIELCTRPPRPRGRADRPRRLRGERAAGEDDGPHDRARTRCSSPRRSPPGGRWPQPCGG